MAAAASGLAGDHNGSVSLPLYERAQADREILEILTDEQSVAVAGCATQRLHETCEL
jgi:hypothetical protein